MPVRKPLFFRTRRVAYVVLGCIFVGLGVVGAVLPVMPTTPFLLVASFFFARCSPRLNRWLHHSPIFGTFLRDWDTHRGVRPRVKVVAVAAVFTAVAASVVWGNLTPPLLGLLLLTATVGLAVVYKLPVIRDTEPVVETESCHVARS